ncbi:MAG: glycosyltransferase [Candidatus Curtissbacteria bacterium]|nr:glycosyltransferase [Candidatus Curtissbacteria bacterium]
MKNIKRTVTIGIPAHNEENNIGLLLESILRQRQGSYKLEKIIVVCDGCRDKTAKIVRQFSKSNKAILLVNDGKRLGKGERINQLFQITNSDIFINFDADITLPDTETIAKMVKGLSDPKVGIVNVKNTPLAPTTLTEKLANVYECFWYEVTRNINDGNNVHNSTGTAYAIRKELFKKVTLEHWAVAEDHYLYFECVKNGFTFKFIKSTEVFYRLPNNLSDYIKQQSRWTLSKKKLEDNLEDWTSKHYSIPRNTKYKAYMYMFLKQPIMMPLATVIQLLMRIYKFRYVNSNNPAWEPIKSSKRMNLTTLR